MTETMRIGQAVGAGLRRAMEDDPKVMLMGEDVGKLGGVFRVTDGLQKDFGEDRVIDTPLAESGILGTAVSSPLALVIIAGILNAIYLIGAAVATLYLSYTQTDPRIRDGAPTMVMLWISAIAIAFVGVYGLVNTF